MPTHSFQREFVDDLLKRFKETPRHIQIVIGPRQVGKTHGARQIEKRLGSAAMYVSADQLAPPNAAWFADQWRAARSKKVQLLIFDEIQKVTRWSEAIKMLWDENILTKKPFHVLLLGSSSLLMQKGMSESLAGRFELIHCSHWSWPECRDTFGWELNQWLFFGGYPGLADTIKDESRWRNIILDSMVETVLARDVLQLQTVTKPALLRQLFRLVCQCPAHVVSYEKMLGQLQDAGNTTTLAHYLRLLDSAFLCGGLPKFSRGVTREKSSSPKLIVHNNALVSALNPLSYADPVCGPMGRVNGRVRDAQRAQERATWFGRLVENAVGATLLDFTRRQGWSLSYWRERKNEVDFVLEAGANLFAIEIKSGKQRQLHGLKVFTERYPTALEVVIGEPDWPLAEFFDAQPEDLLVRMLCTGLGIKLGATVTAKRDYGWVAFTNEANGKTASFPPRELNASVLMKRLHN